MSFNPDKPDNRDKTAAFALHYGVQVNSRFLGGYKGSLDNGGELIHLQETDLPPADEPDFTPHPLKDFAKFQNADPWPLANGNGRSLGRAAIDAFGLIPESWTASEPTPGTYGDAQADSDGDGLPDEWETRYFSNHDPSAEEDFDGDNQSNLVEYHAGTDPTDIKSLFKAYATETNEANQFSLNWFSVPGRSYTVQYVEKMSEEWQNLQEGIPASTNGNSTTFTDSSLEGKSQRYYRILLQSD